MSNPGEANILLPVWHNHKYDTLYNLTDNKCKHHWFHFKSCLDFSNTCFSDFGNSFYDNRICEKCFLWESKNDGIEYDCFGNIKKYEFFGFGRNAFERLTQMKIKKVIDHNAIYIIGRD